MKIVLLFEEWLISGLSMATIQTPLQPELAPVYRLTISDDAGAEVGHVYVYIIGDLARQGKRYALIDNMAIDQESQNKGFGKDLLAAVEKLAQKESCYKIALFSRLTNHRAHAFYIKGGFTFWGHEFRKAISAAAI